MSEDSNTKCKKCGRSLPSNAKFCLECGEKCTYEQSVNVSEPSTKCKNCGVSLPAEAKFCLECGTKARNEEPVKKSNDSSPRTSDKKPCVLCGTHIRKVAGQSCMFCSAPQDPQELQRKGTKLCSNCETVLLFEARICYKCK